MSVYAFAGEPVASVLLARAGGLTCAFDLSQVVEVMRPLPVEPVSGLPELVEGIAVIRGVPVPVLRLAAVFGVGGEPAGRLVVVRAGERKVALSVASIDGIRECSRQMRESLPPLLRSAASGAIETLAACDAGLLCFLNTALLAPAELWAEADGREP